MDTFTLILIAIVAFAVFFMATRSRVSNLELTGDPMADSETYMAYALYDEAEKLVTDAIASDPSRDDLKLRLLEIYFIWGKPDRFQEAGSEFRDALSGTPKWQGVQAMANQVCPDNELFR